MSHPAENSWLNTVFRCQFCLRVSPGRTPSTRVVLRSRNKQYPYRPKANTIVRPDKNGKPKEYDIDDPGGAGREIEREVIACPECAKRVEMS